MANKSDLQWWAGALSAMALAVVTAVTDIPHPYDKLLMAIAVAGASFAMYKVTPNGSSPDPKP